MSFAPKWYRELYKEFAKENPTKIDDNQMKLIKEIDNHLATKGPIASWDTATDKEFLESNANENTDE